MASYLIGDVQGCYYSLQNLLKKIRFKPGRDHLYFTGDLINRGVHSLKVLQWVYENKNSITTVLGNHDLHLLAVSQGVRRKQKNDTIDDILSYTKKDKLLNWLLKRPLMYENKDFILVHAGLHPLWSLKQSRIYAREIEKRLRSSKSKLFLKNLFQEKPVSSWSEAKNQRKKLRFIVDCMTRMRVLDDELSLNLKFKGDSHNLPTGTYPWFVLFNKIKRRVFFGHWAALGFYESKKVVGLDSGCVWGGRLTAYDLKKKKTVSVPRSRKDD